MGRGGRGVVHNTPIHEGESLGGRGRRIIQGGRGGRGRRFIVEASSIYAFPLSNVYAAALATPSASSSTFSPASLSRPLLSYRQAPLSNATALNTSSFSSVSLSKPLLSYPGAPLPKSISSRKPHTTFTIAYPANHQYLPLQDVELKGQNKYVVLHLSDKGQSSFKNANTFRRTLKEQKYMVRITSPDGRSFIVPYHPGLNAALAISGRMSESEMKKNPNHNHAAWIQGMVKELRKNVERISSWERESKKRTQRVSSAMRNLQKEAYAHTPFITGQLGYRIQGTNGEILPFKKGATYETIGGTYRGGPFPF